MFSEVAHSDLILRGSILLTELSTFAFDYQEASSFPVISYESAC